MDFLPGQQILPLFKERCLLKNATLIPTKWWCKCIILLSICVVMFVINFVYDTPGGLEETIIQVMKVDSTQYTLLYSVYSWPAIVTALLSGVIIDRFLGLGTEIVIVVVLATVGLIIYNRFGMFY